MSFHSRSLTLPAVKALSLAVMLAAAGNVASADGHDKKEVEVKTPWGSFDAKVTADPSALGLPLYPGAELLKDDSSGSLRADLKIDGKPRIRFVAGKFQTTDSRDKVRAFYQKHLGKKVTKFTEKDDEGNTVFEIKRKSIEKCVSLKSSGGKTEIDLVSIEGLESDAN